MRVCILCKKRINMKHILPLLCLLFSCCAGETVSQIETMEPTLFILKKDKLSKKKSYCLLEGYEKYTAVFPDMTIGVHDNDEYTDLVYMSLLDRWETLVWFLSKDTENPCELTSFSFVEDDDSWFYGFSFCTTCTQSDISTVLKICVQKSL